MPVPVISSTILKNVFAVGESFVVQLGATNTPTEWNLSNTDTLPAGVFFDTTNGTLFGSSSSAGCYKLHFTAENADGASNEVGFDFGFHNVESSCPCITLPSLPMIQIIVVNPVGVDFLLLSAVCGNHTVVVPVIVIQQDSTCLSAQENL